MHASCCMLWCDLECPGSTLRGPTLQWLKRDLQLVDRCATPWVVLGMHRPMYVVYPHKSNRRVGGEVLPPSPQQSVRCAPFVNISF